MASEVGICNSALRYLRATSINSLNEQSVNAEYCRDAYPELRDRLLQQYEWSFATRVRPLSLLEDDEITNYEYVYQYPSDCLKIRRVFLEDNCPSSGRASRFRSDLTGTYYDDIRTQRIEYEVFSIEQRTVIASNIEDLHARYIYNVTDPNQFSDAFRAALAYFLAAELAVAIIGVDRGAGLAERYYQMFQRMKTEAQVIDQNQERVTLPDSELVTVR